MSAEEERMLTTGEVARYCSVRTITVVRWIKRGELSAYQLPGRGDRRIPVSVFLDFLKRHHMPLPADLLPAATRVLVVEDDAHLARAIEQILRHSGYETAVARNGFEAGSLLENFRPGVMTLDLNMPGLSGLDVLRHIRATVNQKHLRVLIVSAMPREKLDEGLRLGADAVLQKPFPAELLVAEVARLAGREGLKRHGPADNASL